MTLFKALAITQTLEICAASRQSALAAQAGGAGGRISVMLGAGLSAATVRHLATRTGAQEFHVSAKHLLSFEPAAGLFQTERIETDAALVAELVALL